MALMFDNILNFRDVGKTINDYLGRRVLREGVLYRSARPDEASFEDQARLSDELGLKTVIDLRTNTELMKQTEKRRAAASSDSSKAQPTAPERVPGLEYLQIQMTGRRFELFLLSQLSWLSLIRFLLLFLFGYRIEAISLLGREVMIPRGLTGLGLDSLDLSGPEIAKALDILATGSSTPVLIHCTQGKDRTGLLVALVLMALGEGVVPLDAISHDYLLTDSVQGLQQPGHEAEQEQRLNEIREIGLTPEWGACPLDFIERLASHLKDKHGGVDSYLQGIGFEPSARTRLVEVIGA